MTDAEHEARAKRDSEEWSRRRLMQGLGELRIAGRHSSQALRADILAGFFKEFGVPANQGCAAYAAGQRDRANGVRCMCTTCNGQRRFRELKSEGPAVEDNARQINFEVQRREHLER